MKTLSFSCQGWFCPILEKVLTKASKNCPLINDISAFGFEFDDDFIILIGNLFPNLKKFRMVGKCDEVSVASITKKMSGLIELQLDMDNFSYADICVRIRAILNGCPRLQLLGVTIQMDSDFLLYNLNEDLKKILKSIKVCEYCSYYGFWNFYMHTWRI